jgi:FkbM family methyltransferase
MDYLKIYSFADKKRLGVIHDGGYIIGILDGTYDFYISAGVSTEESFSRDFINLYKMNKSNCAAFDGTIKNYPYEYTRNITFYKKNIASYKSVNTANLSYFTENYNNIFLKMDIEGHEYYWLLSLTKNQINKFKQIVIEFHGINDDSWNVNQKDKIECIKRLSETHYPIHIHGNNYGGLTNNIPNVIEVTYVRKDIFDTEPNLNTTPLPIKNLDFSNIPNSKDYDLNFPPFVN